MNREEIITVMREADCLHSEKAVKEALDRMAADITERLKHSMPVVYTVLNGGIVAAGQLLPRLHFPLEVGYLHATRYGDRTSGGDLLWKVRPAEDLRDRSVLVIDDILDEGNTLAGILDYCLAQGAKEALAAVVVNKVHERKARPNWRADFVGLDVEDRFLFGCGMDYKGFWRNTLAIYAVKGL